MRRGDDRAISDTVGTLLMVAAVVMAGSGLALVVATNLRTEPVPVASISPVPLAAGDGTLKLLLRSGDALALSELSLAVGRAGATPSPVGGWTTPDPTLWRPGDTITFALSPPAGENERIRVRIDHLGVNAQLADLSLAIPGAGSPMANATLAATLSPSSIVADSVTAARLAVRVSHPGGALGISSVTADLSNLSAASSSANATLVLTDDGQEGDLTGGDGIWSALVRAPIHATPGDHTIPIIARDIAGHPSASTSIVLNISSNLTGLLSNLTGYNGTALTAGELSNLTSALTNLTVLGNLTLLLSNLTGGTPGYVVLNSLAAGEGTRLAAPTSENLTEFHLRNWTWDTADPSTLTNDAAVVRIISDRYVWSAYMKFGYVSNTPSITRMEMWGPNSTAGRTIYTPTTGGFVPLLNLSLNMTHPTTSGFTCTSQCSPQMTYPNADIRGKPVFVIAYMRDEWNNPDASDLGIYAMEAMLR